MEQKVKARTKKLEESQEKLRQQNIQLKELDKKKNDFITMAAHELKTPLVSIYGYVDYFLMAYQDDLNPDMKRDLKIVQRNIERLRNYMNQLLDVMKIDESKMRLNKTYTNINELIKKCVKELGYLVKKKNHTIYLNLEDSIILNIDSGRIFQVISNLLSNAIKFTAEGGQIIIEIEKKNSQIIVKIKDNGIGIKKENLENIFEKFESFDPNIDNYPRERGTGLGLYISKGIIEAHGGEITAFSEGEGKGSTFTFSLPL